MSTYLIDIDSLATAQWEAAHRVPPPPPPGFTEAVVQGAASGTVVVRSERIGRTNGMWTLWMWLRRHLGDSHGDHGRDVADAVRFDIGRQHHG